MELDIMLGEFKSSKRDGFGTVYYADGRVKKRFYKNGIYQDRQ